MQLKKKIFSAKNKNGRENEKCGYFGYTTPSYIGLIGQFEIQMEDKVLTFQIN